MHPKNVAYRAGTRTDKALNSMAFGFISLPNFATALLLTYWLGVKLGWVPTQGYTSPSESIPNHLKSMVVPVIALSLGQIAVYMRLLRSDLVATLQEDFILMAKSKGIEMPKSVSKEHRQAMEKLKEAKVEQFDRAYMSQMVEDHQKAVKLVQEAAKEAKDPELQAMAQKAEPELQKHLKMAKQISDQAAAGGTAKKKTE